MDFDQTPVSCRGYEQHEDDGGDRHEGCTDQRRCTGRTQIVEPLLPIAFVGSEIGGRNGIGSVQLRHFNFMSRPYLTAISPRSGVHDRNPTGTLIALLIRQGRTISSATSFNVPSNTFVGINRDCGRNAKAATLISGGVEILIVLRGKLVVCEKCDGVPRTFLVKFDTHRKDFER
jgi:hypothetical protein